MKNFFFTVLTTVVSTFCCLIIIEISLRLLPENTKTWSDRPVFYFRDTPSMQGHKYEIPKHASTYRIAVIGDSFTFAPFMQYTDTFSAKLEQMLNHNTGKAEVINYGVPAYSTNHEVGTTKKALSEGADFVLLQITLNDAEIKAHRPTGIRENMDDPYAPYTPPSNLLGKIKIYNFVMQRLHNNKSHKAYKKYFLDLYQNPKSYLAFEASMTELVNLVKSSKKPIVAVVFPLFGLPMDDNYPFYEIHKKVDELLTKLEVPHLDLSEIYKGIPLERMQVIPGGDRHPNEIAHRMAAEKIYLWLEEKKLLPENLLITEKFATRLGITNQRTYSSTKVTP